MILFRRETTGGILTECAINHPRNTDATSTKLLFSLENLINYLTARLLVSTGGEGMFGCAGIRDGPTCSTEDNPFDNRLLLSRPM